MTADDPSPIFLPADSGRPLDLLAVTHRLTSKGGLDDATFRRLSEEHGLGWLE